MKLVVIQRWGKKLVKKKSGYTLNVGLMPESIFSPTAKLLCCDYMEKC